MLVMKFGGSSVESAKAIQRVAAIVREEIVRHHSEHHPAVVVSAMGKTTDRLLAMARLSASGNRQAAAQQLARLPQSHPTQDSHLARAAEAIRLDKRICGLFDELERELREIAEAGALTPRLSDAVLNYGERLSSVIVTAGFRQ